MNNSKVSIVIPVYNTEKYLKECIESSLNQTYNKIEVIAIDDGSTDNSLQILKSYSDKIKIITKPNGGTASALNLGIKKMTGEWFKWLSADDVLYPTAIEELINQAENIPNKKNTILYSNYEIIDSNSEVIEKFIEVNYNNLNLFDFNVLLLDHFIGNGTTCFIHKSVFHRYGFFDESIDFGEDYEFWLRLCLLNNCRLHLVPKILAKYRIHETQLTKRKMDQTLRNAESIRQSVLNRLNSIDREKYLLSLKQLKKKKPFIIKIRHLARDVMMYVLPKSASDKILRIYFNKIKN